MPVIIRVEVIDDETHQVTRTFTEVFTEYPHGREHVLEDNIRAFFKKVFGVLSTLASLGRGC